MASGDCSNVIVDALRKSGCTVIRGGAHGWESRANNARSRVSGVPPIDLLKILRFQPLRIHRSLGSVQVGVNIVRVNGAAIEVESHYHVGHLVGLVVKGSGWLNVPRNKGWLATKSGNRWLRRKAHASENTSAPNVGTVTKEDVSIPIKEGDVVVLPRGAQHVFRCANHHRMEYIALEFSDDQTDYQAHH